MSIINPVASGTKAVVATQVNAQDTQSDCNAFMIILNAYLQDIDAQASGLNCALQSELVLKGYFDQAQAQVNEAQAYLDSVVNDKNSTTSEVQDAEMKLQQAQTQAGLVQKNMNQLFKTQVDPTQTMTEQDCGIAGKAMQQLMRTERTFA